MELEDLKTNRDVHNFIIEKLEAQGRPSVNEHSGKCLYRGPNGTKCAVGHLIKDEHYDPVLEEQTPYDDKVQAAVIASIGFVPSWDLLSDHQCAHDSALTELGLDAWREDVVDIEVPE